MRKFQLKGTQNKTYRKLELAAGEKKRTVQHHDANYGGAPISEEERKHFQHLKQESILEQIGNRTMSYPIPLASGSGAKASALEGPKKSIMKSTPKPTAPSIKNVSSALKKQVSPDQDIKNFFTVTPGPKTAAGAQPETPDSTLSNAMTPKDTSTLADNIFEQIRHDPTLDYDQNREFSILINNRHENLKWALSILQNPENDTLDKLVAFRTTASQYELLGDAYNTALTFVKPENGYDNLLATIAYCIQAEGEQDDNETTPLELAVDHLTRIVHNVSPNYQTHYLNMVLFSSLELRNAITNNSDFLLNPTTPPTVEHWIRFQPIINDAIQAAEDKIDSERDGDHEIEDLDQVRDLDNTLSHLFCFSPDGIRDAHTLRTVISPLTITSPSIREAFTKHTRNLNELENAARTILHKIDKQAMAKINVLLRSNLMLRDMVLEFVPRYISGDVMDKGNEYKYNPELPLCHDPRFWLAFHHNLGTNFPPGHNSLSAAFPIIHHLDQGDYNSTFKMRALNTLFLTNHAMRKLLKYDLLKEPVYASDEEWKRFSLVIGRKLAPISTQSTAVATPKVTIKLEPEVQDHTSTDQSDKNALHLNKILSQLVQFSSAPTEPEAKSIRMNAILAKNPQLIPRLTDILNTEMLFDTSMTWSEVTQAVKDKLDEHKLEMKGIAPPTPAITIKEEKLPMMCPKKLAARTKRMNEYNRKFQHLKSKKMTIENWNKLEDAIEDLDNWHLLTEAFAPLKLNSLPDIPGQVYGIPPGTTREEVLACLEHLSIDADDFNMYTMKSNARSTATQIAVVSIPKSKISQLLEHLTFKKPLILGTHKLGIRLDQPITKPLEARVYEKENRMSTGRQVLTWAVHHITESEFLTAKFMVRELNTEDLKCLGVRWDGFTWKDSDEGGKRVPDEQIGIDEPEAGLLMYCDSTSTRTTNIQVTINSTHFCPSVINFKATPIAFTIRIWVTNEGGATRSAPAKSPKSTENLTDFNHPHGADPDSIVLIYNLPDNARAITDSNHPTATTLGAKERAICAAHLEDEADKFTFASKIAGVIHWEGIHFITAKSPEYVTDLVNRINLRRQTKTEEEEEHRIDFFKQGDKNSDMKAVRFKDIETQGEWTQPKKTFTFTNPNPPNSELTALWQQVEAQAQRIRELENTTTTPSPAAEADRDRAQ